MTTRRDSSRPRRLLLPLALGLLALPLLPVTAPAQSHHATLSGRVTSLQEGRPLGGVELTLRGTELSTTTNGDGAFRFTGVPPGPRTLEISYLGTESRPVEVELRPRQTLELSLVVGVRVMPVTELVVTVERAAPVGKLTGFHRRRENAPGHFITREDIERIQPIRTTALLRRVPGLDVGQRSASGVTPVTMGRRKGCVPQFYVDGARAPFFDVDAVHPREIAGLEIYRGNSEVPIRFKYRDRCGVIVIWTRDPGNWDGDR